MPSAKHLAFLRDTGAEPSCHRRQHGAAGRRVVGRGSSPFNCSRHRRRRRRWRHAAAGCGTKPSPCQIDAEASRRDDWLRPSGMRANAAAADCEQQTWPNLSRVCMEDVRRRNRAPARRFHRQTGQADRYRDPVPARRFAGPVASRWCLHARWLERRVVQRPAAAARLVRLKVPVPPAR